ncbi:zf-RVT domain-containing protein [Cephalotus follicularis]|uniref:Zf-RVT domain-containing protein n=1 Tax=Cephalotus follicularis TaxID=3775 RepID=A0A1Q3CQ46_CEPFO|nr:zf-RVT domain-containing protein [Cephalotus follicularis]
MRIPKHALCLWLALRGAHKTKDKLLAAGVLHSDLCAFNCGERESLEHLFFQCPFPASIWMEVLGKCNISRTSLLWSDEVQWMTGHTKGNRYPASLKKLAFAASVYDIWLERNRCCFKNSLLHSHEIVRKVGFDVAGKLINCKNIIKVKGIIVYVLIGAYRKRKQRAVSV